MSKSISDELLDDLGREILDELELFWEGKRSRTAMIEFTKNLIERKRVEETIDTAKKIWQIYIAPSRTPGEKMVDFDKWLPGQIEDWENQLAQLKKEPTND